jgi:hypothetical protein
MTHLHSFANKDQSLPLASQLLQTTAFTKMCRNDGKRVFHRLHCFTMFFEYLQLMFQLRPIAIYAHNIKSGTLCFTSNFKVQQITKSYIVIWTSPWLRQNSFKRFSRVQVWQNYMVQFLVCSSVHSPGRADMRDKIFRSKVHIFDCVCCA